MKAILKWPLLMLCDRVITQRRSRDYTRAALPQMHVPDETRCAAMQSSDLRLWDSERDIEHLAVQSGGWRRPFALRTISSRDFTVAVLKDQAIRLICRWPGRADPAAHHDGGRAGDASQEAPALLRAHHGRIVLACVCVRLRCGGVAAVSASEDGTVRALVFG